jgi:hypothetical protein
MQRRILDIEIIQLAQQIMHHILIDPSSRRQTVQALRIDHTEKVKPLGTAINTIGFRKPFAHCTGLLPEMW